MKKNNKENNEEDVKLNFSWIKNIFSGKGKKHIKTDTDHEDTGKETEDQTLDFASVWKIASKYSVILLILIPLLLSVYIRTMPEKMPIAENWARQGIYNNIKNNLAAQISQQYPNLPAQNANNLINEQFNLVVVQQKDAIDQAVKSQAEQIRLNFKDEKGDTYLGDIDSYYWLRYAKNIAETGKIGDEYRDGVAYDTHMNAPVGFPVDINIYPYIIAYLYKFLKLFNSSISIMQASFYTPLVLSFFAIIAAFLIGKKLSGNFAGLVAATLIAVNPTILSRSLGSDNDVVNAVFPLLIVLFTLYAFDSKNRVALIINSTLAGLLIGIYSFAWSGWWFMFLFIIGAALIYIGYLLVYNFFNLKEAKKDMSIIFKNKTLVNLGIFLALFFVFSFVSLSFFGNGNQVFSVFLSPIKVTQIKEAARGVNIWPNVYTTVAELNEANIPQIISSMGGSFFFWIALVGSILALVNFEEKKNKSYSVSLIYLLGSFIYYAIIVLMANANSLGIWSLMVLLFVPLFAGLLLSIIYKYKIDPIHSILLIIWFSATLYASTKGIRFVLLIVPAVAISVSMFFGIISEWLSAALEKMLDVNKKIIRPFFIALVLFLLFNPFNQASFLKDGENTAYNYVPSVNDGWVNTLTKIKQESSANAIINSWWDFGHWFKYFSDRGVTFDGASQNDARAHWIGKMLLTTDEKESIGILRMLDCGGNDAFTTLNEQINDTHESIIALYRYMQLGKEKSREELVKKMPGEKADKIISYLFCKAPEDYFITSEDMVGKSGVWAHFGIWDFQKAEIFSYFKTKEYDDFISTLKAQYNYSEDTSKKIYYQLASFTEDRQFNDWIAPWPNYGGSTQCSKTTQEGIIQCNFQIQSNQVIPIQINLTNFEAGAKSNQGTFYPNSFGYFEKGEYKIKRYNDSQIGYGIVLLEDNSTLLVMSEELVGSMFTRLFYLEGKGLAHFNKYYDTIDIAGNRIITWKINWPND